MGDHNLEYASALESDCQQVTAKLVTSVQNHMAVSAQEHMVIRAQKLSCTASYTVARITMSVHLTCGEPISTLCLVLSLG